MKFGLVVLGICLGLLGPFVFRGSTTKVVAQARAADTVKTNDAPAAPPPPTSPPPAPVATNNPIVAAIPSPVPLTTITNSLANSTTNTAPATNLAGANLVVGATTSTATNVASAIGASTNAPPDSATDDIQLSFQGANIEMVVQWLAKITGKSVVKHPRVNCQLTIVSSKKLAPREALSLVYRALALEGFNTIETSKSIMIVPDGTDPKTLPELVDNAKTEIPEGRQRLVKIFPLKFIQANEIKDKIKFVLSEKATTEIADRSNQLIITDFGDNLRLAAELIKELDVASGSDSVLEFFTLKYADAEELGNLIGIVINSQPAPASSPRSSSSGGGSRPPGMPPEMVMGGGSPPPSPSGGSSAGATGQVKIWPDKTSNRLIVAAPKSKLIEIQKLIDLLDTEKPQDISLRVINLKNVNAEDLVREIGPLYQKISGGKGGKDAVEISANTRSNSLIILSSETRFKELERLISSLDTEEASEKVMQAFPLKNADAEDVAKQLQDLNQDQDSQNRYPFYFFSSSPSPKNSKKINVVADKRRNTVMVQAPPAAMEDLQKMIRTLDEPITDNNLAPKIIRLKFVSAVDIEDVLNELFLKKQQQQRMYWDPYGNYGGGEDNDRKGGRLFGKVRITSEPYSNSIIISSNSPENLAAVEAVLRELDSPSQAGETTMQVTLRFAKAITLANSVNILYAKGGSPPLRAQPNQPQPGEVRQPQQAFNSTQSSFGLEQEPKDEGYYPWLGGQQENTGFRGQEGRNSTRPVSDLVGRVRVVPDKRSNSLLITSNLHFFPQVLKLIEQLDAPTPQVLIEATIIEVSSDFRDRLGVRWSPDGTRSFDADDLDNSIKIKTGASYKDTFAGNALANSLNTGILDSSVNVDFLIQFLRKNTDSKVLAQPQINIADNELGKLFVGSQVPFISGSLNTDVGGRNDTFQYRDVGIILEVTPHINNAEDVALRIRAESSNIRNGETLFGGAILDTRNFKTDLMVKSGQTIVLGGIIQRDETSTIRKVPFLGDIPGLGWAFKKKDKTSREVELMVFLKPRVTMSPEQAAELVKEVEQKTPLIKDWEKDSLQNKENRVKPKKEKK